MMRVPRGLLEKPKQMMLIEPGLVQTVVLSKDQNRELETALAQLLLTALQPSEQSDVQGGEEDVVEDYT
jgi:hypothetical protein